MVPLSSYSRRLFSGQSTVRVWGGALLLLTLILGACEAGLRAASHGQSEYALTFTNPLIHTKYAPAIQNFAGYEAERQIAPVNCLILGSSLAGYVDPVRFETAYAAESGRALHCFNFGLMDGSNLVIQATLELLLAQPHELELVVWAMQAHEFFFRSDSAAQAYVHSNWRAYRAGEPNPSGWLLHHSYMARVLVTYAPLLLRGPDFGKQDEVLSPRDAHLVMQEAGRGYTPVYSYKDSAPVFDPAPTELIRSVPSPDTSPAVWDAIEVIGEMTGAAGIDLVMVLMPTAEPQPAARTVIDQAAQMARAAGIPFLDTARVTLPPQAFFDTMVLMPHEYIDNHMHVSGSQAFSAWLGTRIGQAAAGGALGRVDDPLWTPADIELPLWDAARGLAPHLLMRFMQRQQAFDLVAPSAVVWRPDDRAWDSMWLQSNLGLLLAGDPSLSETERDDFLDLMILLDRAETKPAVSSGGLPDLTHTAAAQTLSAAGIDYLLCWYDSAHPDDSACPTDLDQVPGIEHVRSWPYPPLYGSYTLFRVVGHRA